MSLTSTRRRRQNSSLLNIDFDDYAIQQTIREQQYEQTRKAFKSFSKEHLIPGQTCSLENLGRILAERGHSHVIDHLETSISDHLRINIDGIEFELEKPLFPNRKNPHIVINISSIFLREQIDSSYTPDSLADFLEAIKGWIPEYLDIEKKILSKEKQRQMACNMAFDILKRTVEPMLDEKGYNYNIIGPGHNNNASIRITFSSASQMTLDMNLMEDFLNQVKAVIESLPVNKAKDYNMGNFKNIHHCIVIEDYDDRLVKDLQDGGNNIIFHEGKIWIPNMSATALEKAEKGQYLSACYTREDILPDNAPLSRLKAVNDNLDEMLEDLSDSAKEASIERLINGVGYAAHYNRHRYKIPTEVLMMYEK